MKSWLPLLCLCLLFLLVLSASRIYVGGPDGLMIVWKGELSLKDTLVNVNDYVHLPLSEISKHQSVIGQMEDMGLIDDDLMPKAKKYKQLSN